MSDRHGPHHELDLPRWSPLVQRWLRRGLSLIWATAVLGCSGRVLDENGQGGHIGAGGTLLGGYPSVGAGGTITQGGSSAGTGTSMAGADASTCTPAKWVLSNQVINARDLGGIPLGTGLSSACGMLYRGGPASNLTPEGCNEFDGLGIRTVIDLRTDAERASVPDAPCVLAQSSVVWAPLPVPYSLTPEQYIADLNTYSSMALAFQVLGDETAYPIYFHCTYGRDRTGVLAAVILLALGASRDDVYAEYQLTALSGLYLPPDSLNAVLDDIEQRGGVESYLGQVGVSAEQLAVLRRQAVRP